MQENVLIVVAFITTRYSQLIPLVRHQKSQQPGLAEEETEPKTYTGPIYTDGRGKGMESRKVQK